MIDSHESDGEDNQVNYRFKKSEGYHVVPPLYTGNYMPPRADLSFTGLDDYVTSMNKTKTSTSMTSKESLEKPKSGRPSAPIIEEWESDSEDENVVEKIEVKKTVKPSLEKIEFINARNTTVENENKAEKPRKLRQSPRVTNAVRTNRVNDVKASLCWVWKPIKPNSASITLKRYDYVDVRGKSRFVMAWVPKKVKKHSMKLLEWNLNAINVSSAGPAPHLKWLMGIKCSKAFSLLAIKIPLLEHFATEVIEFGDSCKAHPKETGKGLASESSTKKKGRTVVITTKDMQKRRNDVKVRTTLLLALPDEHQLRFSKYEIAQELWEGILKTFGENEATKKTMKNQLKQQYGNFKAEGSETLEQTFNRLQAIMSHLKFMDVKIEQDDLNQKFLRSLAPEWLMYTIVWRNKDDRDTISLDDVYNHLKVYEPEVQKNSESTLKIWLSFLHQTPAVEKLVLKIQRWNALIATKWVILLESTEHLEVKAEEEEKATNKEENHALVADDEVLTEFSLMAKSSSSLENKLEQAKKEKEGLDNKLTGFEKASKDLDNLLGSQRSDKNKEGLGYSVAPPPAQVYSPPMKDLSWTGLPEFVDDTVTDYSRPTPSIDELIYNTSDLQSNNFSVFEDGESSGSIMSKPMIKFVKAANCPRVTK
nr:ribonuclease H-like domain-containing protein [Tanacetum cinerariifolium]